jgi:hypothetical protein
MAEKNDVAEEMQPSPDVERVAQEKADFDIAPGEAAHLAGLRTVELGLPASQVITTVDKADEARILSKIDWRLVPLLSFLYL